MHMFRAYSQLLLYHNMHVGELHNIKIPNPILLQTLIKMVQAGFLATVSLAGKAIVGAIKKFTFSLFFNVPAVYYSLKNNCFI